MWEGCLHRECGKRKRCTGGPRGTLRRARIPFCKVDGNYIKPAYRSELPSDPDPDLKPEPSKYR